MKSFFKVITLKQILTQICPGDWFMSLDRKDAYFHIQVAPHHRRFLRFAFEGVAYEYKVLPFGLSLAPRTFTRCMDAAISPLRQMEIRILDYLVNWLILAQSVLTSSKTLLLSHLDCLGLRVNFAKSILSPSQPVSFLGTVIDCSGWSRGFHPRTVPHWDLPTILRALKGPQFEQLQSTSLRAISLKTALLLALASVKRVGDLQALSFNPACLEFGLTTPRSSWNQGWFMYLGCSPLHLEPRS